MSSGKLSERANSLRPSRTIAVLIGVALPGLAGCQGNTETLHSRPVSGWRNIESQPNARMKGEIPEPKLLPVTHFTSGQLQESTGAYEGAIDQYRKAIALNHNFVEAYERLGILLDRLGRYMEADDIWARAVSIAPNRASIHNNRGFHYLLQRHYERAALSFDEALRIDPTFDRARMNLGIALVHQGRLDDGLALFREILTESDAQYNLGVILRQKGMDRQAIAAFAAALEANPRLHAARLQLDQLQPAASSPREEESGIDADRLASAARAVLADTGVTVEPFTAPNEPCDPIQDVEAEFSTEDGSGWILPNEDKASRGMKRRFPGEYVRDRMLREEALGVEATWPIWCPDRFDYEPTLPVGALVRLNTMQMSAALAEVATDEWAQVRDHMEDTWSALRPRDGERTVEGMGEESGSRSVQEWLASLEGGEAGSMADDVRWGESDATAGTVSYVVPVEPQTSQSGTSVGFDSVDDTLMSPVGETRDFRTLLEETARQRRMLDQSIAGSNRIERIHLAQPVEPQAGAGVDEEWWVVQETLRPREASGGTLSIDAQPLRRWVERVGEVTDLISDTLMKPRTTSEASEGIPKSPGSQTPGPTGRSSWPGDDLTEDKAPVFIKGDRWIGDLSEPERKQHF